MYFLDLLGTLAFAITGAFKAKKANLTLFGVVFLGIITAFGGGTVRDLVIGRTPLFYLADANYLFIAILGSLITFLSPFFFKERFSWLFPLGVVLAIFGVARLVGAGFTGGGQAWIGDLLGIATAFAYGSYQLVIKKLSSHFTTMKLMFCSSVISSGFLLIISLLTPGRIFPQTVAAWVAIAGLALCSQMIGQALIAFAISSSVCCSSTDLSRSIFRKSFPLSITL